jgi:hypothetical protein
MNEPVWIGQDLIVARVQLKVVVSSEALYNLLVSDQRAFSTTEATDHH